MSLTRNFTRNCWRLWRRPAASLWSDGSTTKPTYTQSHLRLHLHTTYLTFYIYTYTHQQNIKYTQSIRSRQASQGHMRSLATSLPPNCWGGLKEETQRERENNKKTNKKIKYFKRFFQIFWRSIFILQFEQAMMSFFRMSAATANLTLRHIRVFEQNQPITCEPVNRDF